MLRILLILLLLGASPAWAQEYGSGLAAVLMQPAAAGGSGATAIASWDYEEAFDTSACNAEGLSVVDDAMCDCTFNATYNFATGVSPGCPIGGSESILIDGAYGDAVDHRSEFTANEIANTEDVWIDFAINVTSSPAASSADDFFVFRDAGSEWGPAILMDNNGTGTYALKLKCVGATGSSGGSMDAGTDYWVRYKYDAAADDAWLSAYTTEAARDASDDPPTDGPIDATCNSTGTPTGSMDGFDIRARDRGAGQGVVIDDVSVYDAAP